MKILFIRPKPSSDTIGLQHIMLVEPLELELLATTVKKSNTCIIVDLISEKQDLQYYLRKHKPEIICFTGYIVHIDIMIESCIEAKKHKSDIITILGGVHIEKFPETANHPDVDYRVVRNALVEFPNLVSYIKGVGEFPKGVLRVGEESKSESELPEYDFSYPIPDRSFTKKYHHKYFYVYHDKVALVKTSFGCPYKCNFCFCREITGNQYHERDIEHVIDEIRQTTQPEIYIIDDNFLYSEKRVRKFLSLLKTYNIHKKYLVYGRADFIVKNPDIIADFQKLGLRSVIVGLESFYNPELEIYNKKTSDGINEKAIEILHKNKVNCYAAIIIPPNWTKQDFRNVKIKLIKNKLKYINLQPLTPLPGIGMQFNDSDLVISRNDYPKWDLAHVSLKPEHMTVQEFYAEILKLYRKVVFRPTSLIEFLKYPPQMQWKLMKGLLKVQKQYRQKIAEM